jgi:intraflagellar transport protein 74
MPSQNEYRELQGDLKFKEKEMKNSENTMSALIIGNETILKISLSSYFERAERDKRLQDLEKVNQLETKLISELEVLKQKNETLDSEIKRLSNIEGLKREAESMKRVSGFHLE